jgi:hypothetical protein
MGHASPLWYLVLIVNGGFALFGFKKLAGNAQPRRFVDAIDCSIALFAFSLPVIVERQVEPA